MSAPRTYMAASVPRFIRTARLSHLPLNTIIGYWFTKAADNSHYVFDVIMLPGRGNVYGSHTDPSLVAPAA